MQKRTSARMRTRAVYGKARVIHARHPAATSARSRRPTASASPRHARPRLTRARAAGRGQMYSRVMTKMCANGLGIVNIEREESGCECLFKNRSRSWRSSRRLLRALFFPIPRSMPTANAEDPCRSEGWPRDASHRALSDAALPIRYLPSAIAVGMRRNVARNRSAVFMVK